MDKGKGPIPTQPVHSTLVPILPTPDRHAGDVGISEHSDGAHDASISPGSNYRNTASEAPLGSFPSTLVQPHTRRFTPNDPYSKLTSVQRDVLLCIKNAAEHIPTPSVYPTHDLDPSSEHNPTWKGVHVSVIIQSVTNRHPELELGLPEFMLVATSLHTTTLITILGTALMDCWRKGIYTTLLTKNITAALNLSLAHTPLVLRRICLYNYHD